MSFLSYVYNLGIESSKTMNLIYSMSNSTTSISIFYSGFQFVNASSLINNATRGLPQNTQSINYPLIYQQAVARSFDTGVYFGGFPYATGSSVASVENTKFTKIIPQISYNNISMNPGSQYEIISELNSYDFKSQFIRNSTHYYDNQTFYFINYYNNYKINDFLSFGYSAYNKSTANSTFGRTLNNIVAVSILEINSLSSSLNTSFQSMVQQISSFTNLSYTATNLLNNFSDNNIVVNESFLNFAGINLSV